MKRWLTTVGQRTVLSAIVAMILALVAGCAGSSSQEQKAYTPHINPAEFTTTIDNEYFPMKPGTTFVYEGNSKRHAISIRLLWPLVSVKLSLRS
jgi:hypothetical protein